MDTSHLMTSLSPKPVNYYGRRCLAHSTLSSTFPLKTTILQCYIPSVASPHVWPVIFIKLLSDSLPAESLLHPLPTAVCSLLYMCLLKAISQALVVSSPFTRRARRLFVFSGRKGNRLGDSEVNWPVHNSVVGLLA